MKTLSSDDKDELLNRIRNAIASIKEDIEEVKKQREQDDDDDEEEDSSDAE